MLRLRTLIYPCVCLLLTTIAAFADPAPEQNEIPAVIATKMATEPSPLAQTPHVMVIDVAQPDSQPGEVIMMSGRLFRTVQGHLDLTFQSQDANAKVDEAFATVPSVMRGIDARLGTMLVPFGRVNPVQPENLPFADNPTVIQNLLGDDFSGNGYEITCTGQQGLLQAHLGQLTSTGDETSPGLGAGFTDTFTLARLSISDHRLLDDSQVAPGVRFGASWAHGQGKATGISLLGADMSWNMKLKGERSLRFQAEAIRRRRDQARPGFRHEFGYYLMGIYQPAHNWEVGARYDWSEVPTLFRTHETAFSVFGTRHFNDANYLRLQVKRGGIAPRTVTSNEVMLQMVFKFGGAAR
jgi:hypothetical protein